MAKKVVVHDVASLQGYCGRLANLRQEILDKSQELNALSAELQTKSSTMQSITEAQASNWRDPQYETMKGAVDPCAASLGINANSMNETAAYISRQMKEVEKSITYMQGLIRKLRS